jgi:hypothetical protein
VSPAGRYYWHRPPTGSWLAIGHLQTGSVVDVALATKGPRVIWSDGYGHNYCWTETEEAPDG